MARTLSPVKKNLICLATLAACALVPAVTVAEQRFQSPKKRAPAASSITIRRPAPPPAKQPATATQATPTAREQERTTAQGPRGSKTTATNFRNPFAANPAKSVAPLLLGPRSRWRSNPHSSRLTPRAIGDHSINQLQIIANAPAANSTIASDDSERPSPDTTAISPPSELPKVETPTSPPEGTPQAPRQLVVTPLDEETEAPARQAILASDTPPATNADLSRLPELQSFPGSAAGADRPQSKSSPATSTTLQLPDPRGFTTRPEEPIWLVKGREQSAEEGDVDQAAFQEHASADTAQASKEETAPTSQPPFALTFEAAAFAEEAANSGDDEEPVIITDYDESPADWIAQAQAAHENAKSLDQYMACINLCQRVVNDGPSTEHSSSARRLAAEAYNRRGEMMSEAGKTVEALAEFEAALANDPESSQAIHNRAVTLAQQSNFDAALADFNRVIELNPELAMAYRNRAELLVAQGKTEEAVLDYTRALESVKTDAEIYNSRAHALQQLGRFDEAIADLKQSIELEPQAAATYTQRANLLAERRDYENALVDFKKSLELDPALAETHRGLAWLKSTCPVDRHRDAFEALDAARTAIKLSKPDDYLTLEALAAAHANAGEFDKAIDSQRRAITHSPPEEIEQLKRRLALYELRQPYRAKH